MVHAKIIKCQMLDWIKACIERDEAMPTDDEIVYRFNLNGVVSARTLLADLAEEGAISVHWNAPGRPITLGAKERAKLDPAKPSRPLGRKPEQPVEDRAERIKAIADRMKAEAEVSSARRVVANRATTLNPDGKVKWAPPPVHDPIPARPAGTPNAKEKPTPRMQVNVSLSAVDFDGLKGSANAHGVPASTMAATLLAEALTARTAPPEPTGKPRVRAAVVKAWQADGRPFDEFITSLIDAGLYEYHRLRGEFERQTAVDYAEHLKVVNHLPTFDHLKAAE